MVGHANSVLAISHGVFTGLCLQPLLCKYSFLYLLSRMYPYGNSLRVSIVLILRLYPMYLPPPRDRRDYDLADRV